MSTLNCENYFKTSYNSVDSLIWANAYLPAHHSKNVSSIDLNHLKEGTQGKPIQIHEDNDEVLLYSLPTSSDVIEISDDEISEDDDDVIFISDNNISTTQVEIIQTHMDVSESILHSDEEVPAPVNTLVNDLLSNSSIEYTDVSPAVDKQKLAQEPKNLVENSPTLPVRVEKDVDRSHIVEMIQRIKKNYVPELGDPGHGMVAHRNCPKATKIKPTGERILPKITKTEKMIKRAKKILRK